MTVKCLFISSGNHLGATLAVAQTGALPENANKDQEKRRKALASRTYIHA